MATLASNELLFLPLLLQAHESQRKYFYFSRNYQLVKLHSLPNITSASSLFRNYMFAMVYSTFVNLAAV